MFDLYLQHITKILPDFEDDTGIVCYDESMPLPPFDDDNDDEQLSSDRDGSVSMLFYFLEASLHL